MKPLVMLTFMRYFGIRKKPATHINKKGGWFGMKN